MSFRICLSRLQHRALVCKGVKVLHLFLHDAAVPSTRYNLSIARYFCSLTTVKLSYIVSEKSTPSASKNASFESAQNYAEIQITSRTDFWNTKVTQKPFAENSFLILFAANDTADCHSHKYSHTVSLPSYLPFKTQHTVFGCKYSINEEKDALTEKHVAEKRKQEEKCRLAININFLINIRCHAAKAKAALQLEVEGYFFSPACEREAENFFPDSSATRRADFIHLSSSSIFVCEEMLLMMMKSFADIS